MFNSHARAFVCSTNTIAVRKIALLLDFLARQGIRVHAWQSCHAGARQEPSPKHIRMN